jgi:hypothetical protein
MAGLVDSAVELGGLRALELAGFERLGRSAPHAAPAAAARWLAGASLAHAWRAAAVAELLPVSVGLAHAAELTTWPGGPLGELATAVLSHGAPDPGDFDARDLVGCLVAELYPALEAAYVARLRVAEAAYWSDRPVARALVRILADLGRTAGEGRFVLAD